MKLILNYIWILALLSLSLDWDRPIDSGIVLVYIIIGIFCGWAGASDKIMELNHINKAQREFIEKDIAPSWLPYMIRKKRRDILNRKEK